MENNFKIIDRLLYGYVFEEIKKRYSNVEFNTSGLGQGKCSRENRWIKIYPLANEHNIYIEFYQGYVYIFSDKPLDVFATMDLIETNGQYKYRGKQQIENGSDNNVVLNSLLEIMQKIKPQDTQQTSEILAEVVSVRTLVNEKRLQIPTYQRPYRWEEKNVRQLLEDILASKNAGKKNYRIGSVILFNNEEKNILEIVDGQQRLTTIFLLLKCWNDNNNDGDLELEDDKKRFDSPLEFGSESFDKIRDNYKFICAWIDENVKSDLNAFVKYVLDNCEFVKIVVYDITEAFQMFDSQNGRGKELEAYNLLKAYHIRAMEHESREEKIKCDKRWEEATQYDPTPRIKDDPNIDILRQLFDEQLYRSRIWSRRTKAEEFSKTEIEEFKGITIDKNHPAQFPYQNPQLLQYLTSKFYDAILSGTAATKNRFEHGDNEHINPFVNINQQIVNGKDFFDYVETYVEIYKQMFINIGTYQLSEFKDFYYTHCLNYCWGGGEKV